jgi:hypothetical protein
MGKRLNNALKWIVELVLSFIGFSLLGGLFEHMPSFTIPFTTQETLAILFLVAALALGIYFVWAWKKSPSKRPPKLSYDHLEARLFYPKKYSWERGERDPKRNPPRNKLIIVKDLKKAYYIGEYAWKLIDQNKIKWFSEDEQDLEEWCKSKDYTLFPEEGTKGKLFDEPYFFTEIENPKSQYRPGTSVMFRAKYRGSLEHGFITSLITHSGKKFPSGEFGRQKLRDWAFPTSTLNWWNKWKSHHFISIIIKVKGKLDGYVNFETRWSWWIANNSPLGEYQIFMRVMTCDPNPTIVCEKEVVVTVSHWDDDR